MDVDVSVGVAVAVGVGVGAGVGVVWEKEKYILSGRTRLDTGHTSCTDGNG